MLDGVETRVIPDPAARTAAFRAGQVDISYTLASTLAEAKAIKASVPDAQVTINPILNCLVTYALNPQHPKFQDARVRRGLSLPFDRRRIVEAAFGGWGRFLPMLPWPFIFDRMPTKRDQWWDYDPAIFGQWWKHDLAQSKQLLTAAGAENLTFEMPFNSVSGQVVNGDAQNATVLDTLRAAGITMNLKTIDPTTHQTFSYGRRWLTDRLEAYHVNYIGPPTASNFYYGHLHSKSPRNISGINDAQIDEWSEKQRSELNPSARKEVLRRIWDRSQDQIFRIELAEQWRNVIMGGHVRYWRWNGPYNDPNYNGEVGRDFHRGWLDK